LPKGYLVILGGTSKAGKSCFAASLVNAVASGEPFMGLATKKSPVLWLAYEESKSERMLAISLVGGLSPGVYTSHECPPIDSPEGTEVISQAVKQFKPSLIVVDPLYGAVGAESLTGGREARKGLQPLKDICNEFNVSAIVLHHFTKATHLGLSRERLADSNQIAATASMDLLMESQDQPGGGRLIRLKGRGRGLFANHTWIIRSSGPGDYELEPTEDEATLRTSSRFAAIRTALEGVDKEVGATISDIARSAGLHPKTTQNSIVGMVKAGEVKVVGVLPTQAKLYSLP
jgi:hypothetical protein